MPTELPPRPSAADRSATDAAARILLKIFVAGIAVLILGAAAGIAVRAFCWLAGIC